LYVDGFSRASSTVATTSTSALFGIYRWGWGFSTSQDFNGDIALIACFASSWTPAMVRRWYADPFGPAPMERAACAHRQCATLHAALDRHGRRHLHDGVKERPWPKLTKLSRDRLQGVHHDSVFSLGSFRGRWSVSYRERFPPC
jgi:hypothetical protein